MKNVSTTLKLQALEMAELAASAALELKRDVDLGER
jgi:hypothetical protein